MTNKLTVYGCRGSIPMVEPQFLRYGGNTSSYVLRTDNALFFLDAGTGIRKAAAQELTGNEKKIFLVISHSHPDHIDGLGCSKLPYQRDKKAQLILSEHAYSGLYDFHSDNLFPMNIGLEMPGIDYQSPYLIRDDTVRTTIMLDDISINTLMGLHPNQNLGGSILFRFNLPHDKSVVYATDTEFDFLKNKNTKQMEPFKGADALKKAYVHLIQNADILIADAQYTQQEYDHKQCDKHGWGHSYIEQILELAKQGEVQEVVLTHHDPGHTDAIMDEVSYCATTCVFEHGFKGKVTMARQGLERLL